MTVSAYHVTSKEVKKITSRDANELLDTHVV